MRELGKPGERDSVDVAEFGTDAVANDDDFARVGVGFGYWSELAWIVTEVFKRTGSWSPMEGEVGRD